MICCVLLGNSPVVHAKNHLEGYSRNPAGVSARNPLGFHGFLNQIPESLAKILRVISVYFLVEIHLIQFEEIPGIIIRKKSIKPIWWSLLKKFMVESPV